ILGFTRLLLQAPERCQPFDRHRKGTILSEGAAVLVLETLSGAKRRGATILAEVLGYGTSCDAAGPFASNVTDTRALRIAFGRALRKARISPDAIDHVSAHGSGTRLNDQKETLFLKQALGERAYRVPVSAIKAMLGHTQGAAALWDQLARGPDSAGPRAAPAVRRFAPSTLPAAGQPPLPDADRLTAYILAAVDHDLGAFLTGLSDQERECIGVTLGSAYGHLSKYLAYFEAGTDRGYQLVNPRHFPTTLPNWSTVSVSDAY